jgi:hypothetical protein
MANESSCVHETDRQGLRRLAASTTTLKPKAGSEHFPLRSEKQR